MSEFSAESPSDQETTRREIAANWVIREDRGLSLAEASELDVWLAADPRHAEFYTQSTDSWLRFREISAAVRRQPVPRKWARAVRSLPLWAGMAAAVVLTFTLLNSPPASAPTLTAPAVSGPTISVRSAPANRRLPDGSIAQLKENAEISLAYSANERRVRLLRGEAFFSVEKDATRPFLVEVDHVTVRAVGTAFAVRFAPEAVDVVVTEGTVQITATSLPTTLEQQDAVAPTGIRVDAGFRGIIDRSAELEARRVVVSSLSPAELSLKLAWKEPVLELKGATLRELVAVITAQSGRTIEIGEPALEAVRIGGRFPIGDVDGFIRVIEEIYEVKSEVRADGAIVLLKSKASGGSR